VRRVELADTAAQHAQNGADVAHIQISTARSVWAELRARFIAQYTRETAHATWGQFDPDEPMT